MGLIGKRYMAHGARFFGESKEEPSLQGLQGAGGQVSSSIYYVSLL